MEEKGELLQCSALLITNYAYDWRERLATLYNSPSDDSVIWKSVNKCRIVSFVLGNPSPRLRAGGPLNLSPLV